MKRAWLLVAGPFTDKEAVEEVEKKLQKLFSSERTVRTVIAEIDGALENVHRIGAGMAANAKDVCIEPLSESKDSDLWSDDEVTPSGEYNLIVIDDDVDDTQGGEG